MTIAGSIRVLLKAAVHNYFALLVLMIILYFVDESSRSQSPDNMGGIVYTIFLFTIYYWIFGTAFYLSIGLFLHRLALRKKYLEIKHVRNLALIFTVLTVVIYILGGEAGPTETVISAAIIGVFIYFTAWNVRRFTLRKVASSV